MIMKKLGLLILILVLTFSFFLYMYLRPRDYTLTYELNGYKITEKYSKKYQIYYFKIEDEVYSFDFVKNYKYSPKRALIKRLAIDDNCVKPYTKNDALNKRCYFSNEDTSYQEVSIVNTSKEIETKNSIKVFNYLKNNYVIWNYKGLDILNEGDYNKIPLFSNDIYNNPIMVQINDLIVFPNYEDGYEYQELIILNIKTGKQKTMKLDKEISNDSYVLGTNKNSIFIIDRKNKIEYEINPYFKKIRIVGSETKMGKIYALKGFDKISINDLVNNTLAFEYLTPYNYEVIDNTLYLSYLDSNLLTKVSDFKKGHVISIKEDKVYYLIEDTLYLYSPEVGNIKLLQKFEWNFNYENKIFIYEK